MTARWKRKRPSGPLEELAAATRSLHTALAKHAPAHNISLDAGSVLGAASALESALAGASDRFEYSATLVFGALPVPRGAPLAVGNVQVMLLVDVLLRPPGDAAGLAPDPFNRMQIDLELSGRRMRGEVQKRRYATWHFDRHEESCVPTANLANNRQPEIHPRYHWQHGGSKSKGEDFGQYFRAGAPRLPHPPMDVVLAADFVLSNFAGKLWLDLRRDVDYQCAVACAHRLLWKPYVDALSRQWAEAGPDGGWPSAEIWPSLVDLTV